MNWTQLFALGTIFVVFVSGILIAILETQGNITGDWAATLWGFLLGSGVGGGGTLLVQQQGKPRG